MVGNIDKAENPMTDSHSSYPLTWLHQPGSTKQDQPRCCITGGDTKHFQMIEAPRFLRTLVSIFKSDFGLCMCLIHAGYDRWMKYWLSIIDCTCLLLTIKPLKSTVDNRSWDQLKFSVKSSTLWFGRFIMGHPTHVVFSLQIGYFQNNVKVNIGPFGCRNFDTHTRWHTGGDWYILYNPTYHQNSVLVKHGLAVIGCYLSL